MKRQDGMNYWCSSVFSDDVLSPSFFAHTTYILHLTEIREQECERKTKPSPWYWQLPRVGKFLVVPSERISWFSSGTTAQFMCSCNCTWYISWRTREVAGSFQLKLSWFVRRRLDSKLKSDQAATYTWMFVQSLWWVELELVYIVSNGIKMGRQVDEMSRGRQTHNLKCHAVGITLSPALLALWGNTHTFNNEKTVHPKHERRLNESEIRHERQK